MHIYNCYLYTPSNTYCTVNVYNGAIGLWFVMVQQFQPMFKLHSVHKHCIKCINSVQEHEFCKGAKTVFTHYHRPDYFSSYEAKKKKKKLI